MKIHPILLIAFTLLISSVFSIIKLRSDAHAEQQGLKSTQPVVATENFDSRIPKSPSSQDGQALLKDVHLKLVSHSSIRARLLQSFHENGKQVLGRGEYLQSAPMRLKYTLEMDQNGGVGKLIQICDSNILWTHQEISPVSDKVKPENQSQYIRVTRRNVKRILDEIRSNERIDSTNQYVITELGMGGLPALFASFSVNLNFATVQETTYNNTDCFVMSGTWTEATQAVWNQHGPDHRRFMDQFRPEAVEIWVDRETLFPLQIRYMKKTSGNLAPLFSMFFEDVKLDEPVDPAEFVYTPPTSITPTDTTREFLDRLIRP